MLHGAHAYVDAGGHVVGTNVVAVRISEYATEYVVRKLKLDGIRAVLRIFRPPEVSPVGIGVLLFD